MIRALLLATALLAAGCQRASVPPPDPAAANRALADLATNNRRLAEAVTAADTARAEPPALASAATAASVRAAFDSVALGRIRNGDFDAYVQLCGQAARAVRAYAAFGESRFRVPGGSGLGGVFGAIDGFQRENLRRFQSELALGNAFNLDCVAHQLEPLSRFLPTLPPARQQQARSTLPEVRRGLARMISGAIDTRRDPVSPANRAVLLDAAARNADLVAPALDPANRRTVIAAVDGALTEPNIDPNSRAKLGRIREAMTRTDCTGLCSF